MTKNISALLREADSLGAAAAALTREWPHLTVNSLLAVERAEIVELGWCPSRGHRDCAYIVTMAALLRPICAAHGDDLPIGQALRLLVDSGHRRAGEIAEGLEMAGHRA